MTRMLRQTIGDLSRIAILLALLLCAWTVSAAATIDSYKGKVESARRLAVELETSLESDDVSEERTREFIAQVRRDFPVSERIEWAGGTVETTSGWLLDKIRQIETDSDTAKRLLSVVEIREYLSAILFKLAELEQAAASDPTKDQDKQKLAEILRREEYQKPQQKQESVLERWLREFLEWLESLFPKPSGPSQPSSGMGVLTVVLQVVLYAVLIALLAFLLYKIVPVIFPQLKRTRAPKKKQRTILGEQLSDDTTAVDLFDEAERLAREGNLRGAIRKGYIALLCDLSDRKVIGLARNKTNRDYLRDVRSRRELHPRMKNVTDTFERHWYGFQESADQDWAQFREEYKEAIRSV